MSRAIEEEAYDIISGRIVIDEDTTTLSDDDANIVTSYSRLAAYVDLESAILVSRLQRAINIMPRNPDAR